MNADAKTSRNQRLEELLKEREDLKDVLEILESQLYKFEGDLLSTAFYGSILNGWNRCTLSVIPSKATPEMLNQKVNDEDRIISRSSVEFMKRMRRIQDQDNRARPSEKLFKQDSTADNTHSESKRKRIMSPSVSSSGQNSSILIKKIRSN